MKTSEPELLTKRDKRGRKRVLLVDSLVPATNDCAPTPDSVAQAKAPVPGEIHWIGPPRESPLSAMYNDTLDLPIREVEA